LTRQAPGLRQGDGAHGRPLRVAVGVLIAAGVAAAVLTAAGLTSNDAQTRRANLAELWRDPGNIAAKDLRHGPGGKALRPSPAVAYEFKESDVTGYSPGYDVVDPSGREWDVKTGDEAQPEVIVSRLLWAVGYRQPVTYFIPEWTMKDGPVSKPNAGRFRLSSDHKNDGDWSWTENPFAGTRQLKGLIVANLIVNNWDLKPSQNRIYTGVGKNPARWFVVQDVGASLGKTSWPVGTKHNIDDFESQRLVLGVQDGRVQFDYHARHRELLADITPADVVWICRLFARITDQQWVDLFAGAHMSDEAGQRYTRKIKSKIQEGLALQSQGATR
jgi:hypothetical protein